MKRSPYELYIQYDKLNVIFDKIVTREETLVKCCFTSIELTSNLIGLEKNKRSEDFVKHNLQNILAQLQILDSFQWKTSFKAKADSYSSEINHLKSVDQTHSHLIDQITTRYHSISKKVFLGIDKQINELRECFDLDKLNFLESQSQSADGVQLFGLLDFKESSFFNSEDLLFKRTHQISELWFKIVLTELKFVSQNFSQPEFNIAPNHDSCELIFEVLLFLADHILVLEFMTLAEYHPLRVALRGASGGQSMQAHEMFGESIGIFTQFQTILKNEGLTIVDLLETPTSHPNYVNCINTFAKLERLLKNFFFQHYMLSSSIIGSQSFGSIGQDLVTLTDRFVEPIFKEIDDAKYHLTLKTNFQYGNEAGKLILEKEAPIPTFPVEKVEDSLRSKTIDQYFEAISVLDMKSWIELFDENGYIEDPVGSRPYIGHKQLGVFFKGVIRFFKKLDMSIEKVETGENGVSVHWRAKAIAFNEKDIEFNGIEVFQINTAGKIQTAKVYWSPKMISDQL